jgi:uncharacterized protein
MPRYVPEAPAEGPVVQGFSGGGFRVDGVVHAALILTPEHAEPWEAPALDERLVARVAALDPLPEFLLLGTGPAMRPPPPALAAALDAQGIGIEAMDSRTAARTWNLLRSEGRWIMGALLGL